MAKIFVSYRRADAETEAGRLTDWLDRHFGEAEVFMDIEAIGPGENFKTKIGQTIESIDALVAVIGRSWVDARDEDGRRRLDDPNDVLRLEVANALARGILVVPICVQGAQMPRADDLPENLRPLVDLNALSLSNVNWKPGMDRLIAALDGAVRPARASPHVHPEQQGPRPVAAALVGAALLLAGLFVVNENDETLLHPRFGGVSNFHGSDALWRLAGLFTSLPTVAIAAAAALGALSARRRDAGLPLAAGLVLAAGAQGVALYVGVITAPKGVALYVVPLLGGALVLGGGLALAGGLPRSHPLDLRARTIACLGAAAMLAGATIEFNSGGTSHRYASSVLGGQHVERWDVLLVAALALAAALTPLARHRLLAAGLLLGCGGVSLFVWLRFVAIPLIEVREVATPAAGAYVGLAGACLVSYAGVAARRVYVHRDAVAPVSPAGV